MTRDEWLALAERCRNAKGADREIDDAIVWPLLVATGLYRVAADGIREVDVCFGMLAVKDWRAVGPCYEAPSITASMDAFTALIERELPEASWRVGKSHGRLSDAMVSPHYTKQFQEAEADTPALALCAAFCRAMAEKADQEPG